MDYTVSDTHFLSTASGLLPPDTIALLSSRTTNTQLYLSTLSRLALRPDLTTRVFSSYEPLFPDLCARWRDTTTTASEIACAFARVLPLAPYLADVAEEFLTPGSIVLEDGLEVLLALWRLLVFRRESFSGLVKIESVAPLLTHKECAVRYLAVRVMCIFLKASDSTREEMFAQYGVGNEGEEKVIGAWEGKEIDYGFLVLMENKRLENLAKDVQTAKLHTLSPTLERRIIPTDALSPLIADLCGILTPRLRGPPSTPSKIIDTPTTRHNIHATAVSLRSSSPTLITGPAGSGKTFTVHQIAHTLNTLNTLISIHLGDQTDAKLLVGAYTTADTPGSFEWRPGVLTAAVKEGRWVLVEDIDKAPTEVLSVLLPLMERGELVIPSRGETIVAARGFRLIATMRTASTTNSAKQDSLHILGSRLWNRVDYKQPDETELHTIITARFPVLTAVAPSLLRVYNTIQHLYREPSFFALSKTSLGRQITPRDLIKWATRIDALFTSAGSNGEVIPEGLYDEIFMEAVDCFAGSLQTLDARHLVIRKIADEMLIPPQRVDLFLNGHIPAYNASDKTLAIGRAKLKKRKRSKRAQAQKRPFATTNHALRLLEQVGVAVRGGEPVLLVGETGTGKTTVVQQMADLLGYGLTVMNLSQQTESGDLLGGYKPVDVRTLAVPLKEVFEELFEKTFSLKRNKRFLEVLAKCWGKQQWNRVITLWGETVKMADQFFAAPTPEPQDGEGQPKKKRKIDSMDKPALQAQWTQFASDVATLERQSSQISKSFAFSFVEGSLVKAARNGDWVLLDEINLAAPDTLESIADLLKDGKDGDARSILLSEKGDVERVRAHPDFRIFACMNPATDVGKRDLPSGLRSRFTELYVVSPDQDLGNLLAIVREYLGPLVAGDERAVADVAGLYMEAKKLSEGQRLVDGANQRPHFSMRTLTRTLSYVVEIAGVYGLRRSLYEGFCMSFLTLLDRTSEAVLLPVIEKSILGNQRNVRSLVSQIPRRPVGANGEEYVQFKHYWMARGTQEVEEQPHYIITPFVERNMLNLVRATATRRFPVLIQGPTSSGKTSMIEYLAKRTGHKFVRINNHEHTDLQEYLGSYVSDNTGTLRFQEGILVEALRKGYWIVLDELNLAPTDVLEALNRLLDDNRELMIPETQEVVRPHKEFMLFATQNPPGLYGGRKVLSRAFRNRFLELHFDDIPEEELETILRERCGIAPSYCAKIVKVYKELSVLRQSTRLFEQKNSFATLRDLFRWANREAIGYQQLADNGYMLLAERVRKEDEKLAVKKVLEEVMRVKIDEAALYSPESTPEYQLVMKLKSDVVWTKAMRRLYSLVAHSLRNNEPVLLVGETGCGKTTVVQLLAEAFGKQLNIVNAHQNTETGDIIGAQRPIRNRTAYTAQLVEDLLAVVRDHSTIEQYNADVDLSILLETYLTLDKQTLNSIPEDLRSRIELNRIRVKALFEWSDGSLIQAMKEGQFFLLDEISLADDSVLERLNSVLEPQRGILLAEKGPEGSAVTAADGFQFLATMNPGGDYGKKELSPALRNRFTEIWVPSMSDYDDVLQIVSAKLSPFALQHAETIVKFAQWFSESYHFASSTISIRDVLAWVRFINMCDPHNTAFGLLHGAALVFIDGLGANPSAVLMSTAAEDLAKEKRKCILKLSELSSHDLASIYDQPFSMALDDVTLRLGGFSLPRKIDSVADVSFNLEAPTTGVNAMRVVRAMQLRKPILLEGSPGVGKTSLISALAAASGNPLTRINLSEQTDLMDLFGSDVPVEGGQSGEFAWRDAPFLQAMQRGHWVLLDEMNLASQSVLEGLNACLDHRGEAYISELDRTFKCHPEFCVFAAQNPHHQGGGRKGLPASFVNRFTVVYVDTLNLEDLQLIATRLYPNIPQDDVAKVITFVVLLDREVSQKRSFGSLGGPWEFNLRDTLRWLGLLSTTEGLLAFQDPSEFVDIVIKQRFRTVEDRARVDELFAQVFGFAPAKRHLYHQLSKDHFQIGHALLPRNSGAQPVPTQKTTLLKRNLRSLETIMTAIQQRTPVILVGPSGAGKSSIIKLLASVAGAELDEIALNSDIDTTDIVGGFEQVDISRSISALFAELQRFVGESTIQALRGGFVPGNAVLALFDAGASEATYGVERLHRLHTALTAIAAESGSELFTRFIKQCEILISQAHQASTARFEWVDGMLIYAIEQGKWLVLDNANLCSPSVLDRLNSLLELNGYLVVNEHSDTNGEPKIVRPHANFRLFLTMDPRHGELSRAMRNRGMEVYMDAGVMEPMPPAAQEDDVRRVEEAQWMADATTTEACMAVYSDIDRLAATPTTDIGSSDTSDVYDELLQVVFDHLPRDQMSILKRWKTHIIAASQMDADRLAPIVDVVSSVEDLSAHPRLAALLNNGKKRQVVFHLFLYIYTDRNSIKPLNPIRNTSLLSTGSRKNNSSAIIALSAIHDLAREILHIKLTEADILQRSTTTRMKEMTFLEKSASKSKASSSISAQSASSRVVGLPLFAFLTAVRRSLEAWLTEQNTLARITELLALWRDMVALSNTHNLNESIFHVYLSLLESWVHTSSPTLPPAVLTATERALGGFRAPLRLTTGFAMEALWGALRPSVPASVGAWEAYNRLRGIADRFDAVVGKLQCSFETVAGLKSSLMEALTAVLTSEVEVGELVEGLEGAIVGLEERAGRSGVAARESLLRMVFDYLLKFKALGEDKSMLRTGQAARNSFIGQLSKLNIELGALSKQFTQLTQQVTSDQLLQLNMLLLSNTKKVGDILTCFEVVFGADVSFTRFLSSIPGPLISALENLELALNGGSNSPQGLDLSTATLDVAFKSVVDEHLAHALNCLAAILQATSYSQALELSGKAWTHYALGCLKLYVPNVAFDPAMKRLVQRERYLKRKTELHNKIAAEKIFELRFTGQQDNAQIQVLEKRLANLGEEPPNSLVVRPAESEMTQLQGDMINLLQVVVSTSPHERLLSSILERRANYRDEEALFQKNLSQIIERLRRGYPLYKDLVDPILGFLYSLKMGLSLSAMEAEESSLAISLIEPSVPEVFNQEVIDGREDIKLLRLWQIAVHQNIEGYENTKQMSNKTAHSILQDFFEAWKIKTQKEQEEAAANASLYRYTGEEENADETELAAMFPAYEEEEKEKEKEKPAGSQHRELACQIALCHSAIHLTTEPEPTALSSLIRRGVSSLVKSIGEESSFCISPAKTEAFLPAIILSLKETSQWINGVTSQTYDFYTEENLEQARKLVVIVEKAHARLSVLAEAWPEHVTIQDAMEVCQELLDLPNSTPIAQSLVKVEKLHEHLNEWQGVASTEFSAAEHFDAVTQLIISWRRIELSAWPRLFNIEDEKCREEANSWWFYVYESAIANPLRLLTEGQNLKEHVEQLLTTLVAFIETSSIAQFPHRLQLLKAFEQHALRLSDEFPAMNLVEKGLHNLIAYFSQYASEAKEATAKSRKKYQKSMSDVVLLASWKDTNILALRDSAKRSHKKLFRVVKGYRQAINQPMAPLILAGMPEGSAENSATNRALPEPTNGLSIDFELIKGIYEKFVKNWTERPARLQDLPAAVQMMKRVARIPEDRAETINFIEDFSSSIISTIKQLQSETPGTLNDETKEIAKHLKTRKRKAFADALKELKNMGLKSNLSAALLGKQATLERILALADPLENSQTGIQGHSENHYFLRIAEILPKIRKAVVEHSPDL
ncbi:P-loop containing nucleoside triphosphate hydrolase protein, partial [Morchella snyderi]